MPHYTDAHDSTPENTLPDDANTSAYMEEDQVLPLSPIRKRKRRTVAEKADLTNAILIELQGGNPPQAIALKHDVTLDVINAIVVSLIINRSLEQMPAAKYDVVKAGCKINSIPMFSIGNATHVRIETIEGEGVMIQPFDPSSI